MTFLPTNYAMPKNGDHNYLQFQEGENRFRILSDAAVGWLYWQDEQGNVLANPAKGCKTVYVKNVEEIAEATRRSPNLNLKHFWAFVVWNYTDDQVKIAKLTQYTLMKDIERYIHHPKWGDPKAYDIVVYKQGEGLATEYQVTVNPKEPLEAGIVRLYQDMNIDLEALFRGEDPFKTADNA